MCVGVFACVRVEQQTLGVLKLELLRHVYTGATSLTALVQQNPLLVYKEHGPSHPPYQDPGPTLPLVSPNHNTTSRLWALGLGVCPTAGPSEGPSEGLSEGPSQGSTEGPSQGSTEGYSEGPFIGALHKALQRGPLRGRP